MKRIDAERMTADEYRRLFWREPVQDDLERVRCTKAGQPGHWLCGVCDEHLLPRFVCGCALVPGRPTN